MFLCPKAEGEVERCNLQSFVAELIDLEIESPDFIEQNDTLKFMIIWSQVKQAYVMYGNCVDYLLSPAIWIDGFANLCIFQLVLSTSRVLVSTGKINKF